MSALGYEELRRYLTHEDAAARLVVTPLLDPSDQLKANQAAIDVRLGRVFALVRPWTQGVADAVSREGRPAASEPRLESVVLGFGQPLIIHPHQFVLARTLEILRLPLPSLRTSSAEAHGVVVA